jgi:hypothetical protein
MVPLISVYTPSFIEEIENKERFFSEFTRHKVP